MNRKHATKIVAQGYDSVAERYLEWTRHSRVRKQILDRLVDELRPSSIVLDLGCGSGEPAARRLIEAAHLVVGVDISAKQIALASAKVPEAAYVLADMTRLQFAERSFDAVVALYSITHVPRENHFNLFLDIHRWLQPEGLLVASLGADDLDGSFATDWLGAPNYFSHFDARTNLNLVSRAGFEFVGHEVVAQEEPDDDARFLWIFARKAS